MGHALRAARDHQKPDTGMIEQQPLSNFNHFTMTVNAQPKVLLFGSGGIGTVYLWLLSKNSTTTAVCRSNYEVAKKDGFIINSSIFGQGIHFRPNVVRNCEEAASVDATPFDYIVVCSKAIPDTVPKWITPVVTPGRTVIVLLQNGIGIEEEYRTAFPTNPIVSTVLYFPATQRPVGVITHGEIERLEIGAYPSTESDQHAKAFAQLIQSAGATALLHDDIQLIRWTKLLINASWNPICALALSKDTEVLGSCEGASNVIKAVMMEIRDIASAYGYHITTEKVDFELGRATARIPIHAGIEPSMLQDVKTDRRIEVEAILGNTVRLGKAKGVRCDRVELLYVLAKTLDLHIGRKLDTQA